MIHLKPSWMPSTSNPASDARIVAAAITLLIPGAGPPPQRIARRLSDAIAKVPPRATQLADTISAGDLYPIDTTDATLADSDVRPRGLLRPDSTRRADPAPLASTLVDRIGPRDDTGVAS